MSEKINDMARRVEKHNIMEVKKMKLIIRKVNSFLSLRLIFFMKIDMCSNLWKKSCNL